MVQFLAQCHSAQTLDSYLIMPVQRIPRYRLLLTELVKLSDAKYFNCFDIALKQVERALSKKRKEKKERKREGERERERERVCVAYVLCGVCCVLCCGMWCVWREKRSEV